jgi:hypothetical protein
MLATGHCIRTVHLLTSHFTLPSESSHGCHSAIEDYSIPIDSRCNCRSARVSGNDQPLGARNTGIPSRPSDLDKSSIADFKSSGTAVDLELVTGASGSLYVGAIANSHIEVRRAVDRDSSPG